MTNSSKSKDTKLSAFEAISEAQKIAFSPVVFQVTQCLLKFGILEQIHLAKTGISKEKLHDATGISVYGINVLLELALASNLVTIDETDNYFITKTSYFLLKDPMTKVNFNFIQDVCYQGLFFLDESILQEKPVGLKVFGDWPTIYPALSQLPKKISDSWFEFDHFYSDNAFDQSLKIVFQSQPKTILDIGGNTAKWTKKCCEFDSEVKVSLLDLPGQLQIAQQNIIKWNFQDRVSFIPINVLNPQLLFPRADVIWMSQFLDCFSPEQIVAILIHTAKNMNESTDLFIMETFWDNQVFEAAKFSLAATSVYFTAMANGNSKMYGYKEFCKIIEKSNLRVVEIFEKVGISHTILRCRI